jgi:hypothetical protein
MRMDLLALVFARLQLSAAVLSHHDVFKQNVAAPSQRDMH